jgi:hypothetical protein
MLVSVLTVLGAPARAEEPPPPSPSPRPISDSVDRVVQKLEDERADPCKAAVEQGRPCFPVTTTIYGPEFSVRDSLRAPGPRDSPTPGRPPTASEMGPYRPGLQALPVPLVKFDPGCVAKSVLKSLKGKNDVYYLYRVRDTQGERVALYDRRLEAATFQGDLEFLGRFDGECDALAAYRHEELKRSPTPPPAPRPTPSPSAIPARR